MGSEIDPTLFNNLVQTFETCSKCGTEFNSMYYVIFEWMERKTPLCKTCYDNFSWPKEFYNCYSCPDFSSECPSKKGIHLSYKTNKMNVFFCCSKSCMIETHKQIREAGFPVKSICNVCNTTSETMYLCGKCKSVGYCSKSCQQKDWNSHKGECKY